MDRRRCREVAVRLDFALAEPNLTREIIMAAAPAVTERSGRRRSLVELIELDPGHELERLRLAKLFLRALDWS